LTKNWNFSQKLNFLSKIEIWVKKWNFLQNSKFWWNMKILSKLEILVKNWNFGQQLKFWSSILLVQNWIFVKKSNLLQVTKIRHFDKNRHFGQKNWFELETEKKVPSQYLQRIKNARVLLLADVATASVNSKICKYFFGEQKIFHFLPLRNINTKIFRSFFALSVTWSWLTEIILFRAKIESSTKFSYWQKVEIVVKNWNFGQKLKFGQKMIFWSKNEIVFKKLKFW